MLMHPFSYTLDSYETVELNLKKFNQFCQYDFAYKL